MDDMDIRQLLDSYERLLALYEKLGEVSALIYEDLRSGTGAGTIAGRLRENAGIAEHISRESELIVKLKKSLTERGILSDTEKSIVRQTEKRLADTVNRVIEQENKSRDFISNQGMKISRR